MAWGRYSSQKMCGSEREKKLIFTKICSTPSPTKTKKFVWKIIMLCIVEKLYSSTRMTGIKTSLVPYHLRNYPSKQHHWLGAKDWPIPQNSIFRDTWVFPLLILIVPQLCHNYTLGNHQTQRSTCSNTQIHN